MGVGGEELCCEGERALSVQMDAGKIPRERGKEGAMLEDVCKGAQVSL